MADSSITPEGYTIPMRRGIARPHPEPPSIQLFSDEHLVYVPPSEEAIKRYREETYPAWLNACISQLAGLPTAVNNRIAPLAVTVSLDNKGFRPAENVRIRFTARGPLLIAPNREEAYHPVIPNLPQAPRPPAGHWTLDGDSVAVATAASDAFDQRLLDLGLDHFRLSPLAREDEAWYYEPERPEEPLVSYDLVCRRFHHGANPKPFELLIFPQSHEAVIQGALEVEVSASNLGRPVSALFPVGVTTTFKSSRPLIEEFLDRQDLIPREMGRNFF